MTNKNDDHLEDKLDEALSESFPASDPTAVDPPHRPWKNEELHRYEYNLDGKVAFLQYILKPGEIHLIHTEVPDALQGRGIAGMLAQYALEDSRTNQRKVKVICPFVKAYMKKHPEYDDLLV